MKGPLGSQLSPTVCWPYRKTSLAHCLQRAEYPFSSILNLGSFPLNKSAFSQAEAFDTSNGALIVLGQIKVLLFYQLEPPFPYPSCLQVLPCFRFLNPWEGASFNHFCIYLLLNGSVFTVNFWKYCYQELCHSLNALLLGNFLHPTNQHISFKFTFTQVLSTQVAWN